MTTPLALLALLLLAGCGAVTPTSDGTEPAHPPATEPGDVDLATRLEGSEWLSSDVTVDGDDHPLVAGTQIRLTFRDGNVTAQAGCNTIGGRYEVDGEQLVVGEVSGTEMGCDGPRHAQDRWLGGVLAARPTLSLDGTTLMLTAGNTAITLEDREVAEPDQALVGTLWVLDSLLDGGAVSSVPQGVTTSVRFDDDGTVGVNMGCNSGSGPYSLDGDRLRVGDVMQTLIGCEGAQAAVEAAMQEMLARDLTVSIEADTLTLSAGDRGLGFRAEEGP